MPLRLKALELHGYKTFAARTLFEFAEGITAIVGPNGAGKSNIADSLRWVLGEQSYSLLRGKKTEDMIFSGSEYRPRAGMASVEIVFDNTTNWLPLDFPEVGVARRAYRDGHNEYVLNGQHVRLRDMNELLAAAGLSERTYTIVGQGLVDASLALKADERRRLFEEAAGVGLYRVRREEALKRLEATRRNVERVEDIMGEIEPRLKTLERQARRANEYAAAQADLRLVLREWYGFHWHRTQEELQAAHKNVATFQEKAAAADVLHEASQEEYGRFRGRLHDLRTQLSAWHHELGELHQERQSAGMDLAVLDERRRALIESQSEILKEQQAQDIEEEVARRNLGAASEELHAAESELEDAVARKAAAEDALAGRQQVKRETERQLQEAAEESALIAAGKAELKARLDAIDANLSLIEERQLAAAAASQSAEGAVTLAERASAEATALRVEAEQELSGIEAECEQARQEVSQLEGQRSTALEERARLVSAQSRLAAQLDVVDQAERAMTGYAEGARFLLNASRQELLRARGALGSLLDLPTELETAISAALGEAVESVLLDGDQVDRALELLETPDAGRAVLLPLNGSSATSLKAPEDSGVLGVASALVQAPPDLRGAVDLLLGNTLVVRSREAAQRLLGIIPPHGRIVTLRGEVFRGDGLIAAGRIAASPTLGRPRQQRELAAALGEMGDRLANVDTTLRAHAERLAEHQGKLSAAEGRLLAVRQGIASRRALEDKAGIELEAQRRSLDWQRSRLKELVDERSKAENERKGLAEKAAEHDRRLEEAHARVQTQRTELDQLGLEELQERAAYWSTRAAVVQQSVEALRLRVSEHEASLEKMSQRAAEVQARSEEGRGYLLRLDADKAAQLEREHALLQKIEALQAAILPSEAELEAAEVREAGLAGAESSAQKNTSAAQRTLAEAEIELVRRQEALDSLRARIIDDFGLVAFDYAENIEGPVPLPFEGLVEDLPVVTELAPEVEEQLQQRRTRLRRLGAVNPEAAKEYEVESERYSFMSAQIRDLRQAEEDLREVIAELDELTRQEFSKTYAAVDRQFRAIFTRLFGGGAAHLELTDPDNLVETGIEIEARLPGRREQGLSLLSGGERSLTAIALVCALLKVSPTPVCVMDEVDAMLDEANVGRFRDLLAELSQETQFIIITHNRNTVQAADVIYGVTMGRDSTSQIISLKLDEVSEEMLGTSRA